MLHIYICVFLHIQYMCSRYMCTCIIGVSQLVMQMFKYMFLFYVSYLTLLGIEESDCIFTIDNGIINRLNVIWLYYT